MGQQGGDTIFSIWLTIPGLLGGICGLAGFIVGGIAITFRQERSPGVVAATAICLLVTLILVAELVTGDQPARRSGSGAIACPVEGASIQATFGERSLSQAAAPKPTTARPSSSPRPAVSGI